MHLLYILSGKNGITSFTYKELELLEEKSVNFTLLFTKFNKQNSIPKESWDYLIAKRAQVFYSIIPSLPFLIFSRIFYEAISNRELKYLLTAFFFKRRLKSEIRVTNVHVQMGDHKLILGYYLKRLLVRPKLSTTIHAHELYSRFRYDKVFRFRQLLDTCAKIFTISNFNKEIIKKEIGVDIEKIDRMYLYPSFVRQNIKTKKKILITGNWEYKKGYLDVMKTLIRIDRDDFIVLIAGHAVNPDVDLDLPLIIKENGLESKVKLLGHVNKTTLEILYSYCDIFLLPSKTEYYPNGQIKEREGIPVAIMEAIQFNLPIITTKHAGIPELVEHYLIEEGNIDQMKDAITTCLDDQDKCRMDANKNAEVLNEKFTFDNITVLSAFFLN